MTPAELHNIFRTEADFWWYRGMRAITAALLDPVAGSGWRALEAGCGTGYNALQLQERYRMRMVGIDLALLAVQYCRKRRFEQSAVASVMELPFPDRSFQLVSSIDVLPVLPPGGDRRALSEFHRVLSPGGWLVLRAAAFQSLSSRHSQFVAERHRYRAGELLAMLAELGLQVVRHTYANTLLAPLAWLKFRVWEPLLRVPPQSGVAHIPPLWLNTLLAQVLLWEAALIRRGVSFPYGQSWMVVAQKMDS
jgi:ubiquinone/menaquinone biosynthesis C-methylase UbiE